MSIIYSYPIKGTPANDDLILISDSASSPQFATKQIKVSSLPGGSASGVSSFNTLTGAVTITGGTNVTLNPVGNNIEINASGTSYSTMTSTTEGIAKIFSDTTQPTAANTVSSTASRTYGVQLNSSKQLVVNVPWVGGGSGGSLNSVGLTMPNGFTIANSPLTADGTIDVTINGGSSSTYYRGDGSWGTPTNTTYSAMTTSTLGLGKLKYDTGSTPTAEAQSVTAGRTYGITSDDSDQLVVNVPWVDTNTAPVDSVSAGTPGTSNGTALTVSPTTGAVKVTSNSYAGTTNVGHVPAGGSATTFLRGDGTWQTPSTSGGNIYSVNGALAGNRTVALGNYNLYLSASPETGTPGGFVVGAASRTSSNPMMEVVGSDQVELLVNATAGNPDIGFAVSGVQKAGIRGNSTSLELLTSGSTVALTLDSSQNAAFAGNISKASALTIGTSSGNSDISLDPNPSGSGIVVLTGGAGRGSGQIKFNCDQNSHGVILKGPAHSAAANYTLTLPTTDGNASEFLQTDGSGGLSWAPGSSSKLGFTPLSIYEATGTIESTATEGPAFSYIRQSVCETDCTIDKVDFFRLSGTAAVTVGIYTGNISTGTGTLRLSGSTQSGSANSIVTLSLGTPYTFTAGDDIIVLVSLNFGNGNNAQLLGASNLHPNAAVGRKNSIWYSSPPGNFGDVFENFEDTSGKAAALHFYGS